MQADMISEDVLQPFLAAPNIVAILNAIKHWPGRWVRGERDSLIPLAEHYLDKLERFAVAHADEVCGSRPTHPLGAALSSDPLPLQRQASIILGWWQPIEDWRQRRAVIWQNLVMQGVDAFRQIALAQVRQSDRWENISQLVTSEVLAVDRHFFVLICDQSISGDNLHLHARVRETVTKSACPGLDLDELAGASSGPKRRTRRQRQADARRP